MPITPYYDIETIKKMLEIAEEDPDRVIPKALDALANFVCGNPPKTFIKAFLITNKLDSKSWKLSPKLLRELGFDETGTPPHFIFPIMHHGKKICGDCGVTGEVYHKSGCKIAIDLIGTYGK